MSKLKDYDQLIQRRRSLLFYQNRKKTILYNGVKLVKGEDQILDLRKGRNFEEEIDSQYNASIVLKAQDYNDFYYYYATAWNVLGKSRWIQIRLNNTISKFSNTFKNFFSDEDKATLEIIDPSNPKNNATYNVEFLEGYVFMDEDIFIESFDGLSKDAIFLFKKLS